MKKILFLGLLLLNAMPAFAKTEITGNITFIEWGEVDPFYVGDVCVIEVETKKNVIGLITDFDWCVENQKKLKVGKKLVFSSDDLKKITDKDVLNLLSLDAEFVYRVDAEALEKNLGK